MHRTDVRLSLCRRAPHLLTLIGSRSYNVAGCIQTPRPSSHLALLRLDAVEAPLPSMIA